MKKSPTGFTLVEIAVTVSVVAILSTVVYANFNEGRMQSRDAKRQADLTLVQAALELYRQENDRYPAGCNGASGDSWSGQLGTSHACTSGSSQYIVGLAPKYIKVLPTDPKPGTGDYGYVYLTNVEGTVYKFVSRKTVESKDLGSLNDDFDFLACDLVWDSASSTLSQTVVSGNCTAMAEYAASSIPIEGGRCTLGVCNRYSNGLGGFAFPADCNLANIGQLTPSYAVWGGIANPGGGVGGTDALKVEYNTERILCDMP